MTDRGRQKICYAGDSSDDGAGGGRHYEDVGDDIVVSKRSGGAARRSVTGKKATHYPTLGDVRQTLQYVRLKPKTVRTHVDELGSFTEGYVSEVVPPSALKSARRVVVNVRNTLMEKINNSNWIRDSVWCLMIGKAKAMRLITGYPKQFANKSLVEAFFAAFPRARNKFFTPYMKSHRLLTTRIFKEQATENFTLSSVNAYYLGSRNTITIYPGLLQPPFFFKDAPAAINYGGLGQ
ncbi:hypothetical protein V5799_013217, partial [Amblyomma americanum]